MTLQNMPSFPRLNFDGSSGSFFDLLTIIHEMETMYDDSKAQRESEEMLLKATVEPMLIKASRHDTRNETKMALIGTSHPGGTYLNQA